MRTPGPRASGAAAEEALRGAPAARWRGGRCSELVGLGLVGEHDGEGRECPCIARLAVGVRAPRRRR